MGAVVDLVGRWREWSLRCTRQGKIATASGFEEACRFCGLGHNVRDAVSDIIVTKREEDQLHDGNVNLLGARSQALS